MAKWLQFKNCVSCNSIAVEDFDIRQLDPIFLFQGASIHILDSTQ